MAISSGVKKYFKTLDYTLIIFALLCSVFGLIVCKSATAYKGTDQYVITQFTATVIGIGLMFFVSTMDYDLVIRFSKIFYIGIVGLLIVTLLFGHGDEVGSKSWLSIPGIGFNFQTAEFAKLIFAVTFAYHLDSAKQNINSLKNVVLLILHMGLIVGLVLLQGDLGTALVFLVMFASMCFYAGLSPWYFVGALGSAIVASPIIWRFLPEYRRRRILVGFNPDLDPLNWGYQQIQSRKAISLGEITGSGFGEGYLTAAGKVPKQETDFAFAVLGENFGLIGCIICLAVLSLLIFKILKIARQSHSDAGGYMCVGIASMLIFQVAENIGMCLGILPVIGIPLPFFSYGGSSILSIYLGIGIALAVSARKNIYFSMHNDKFTLQY